MKNLIIFISILITNCVFGQSSGGGTINLKIFFEPEISIENIEVSYVKDDGSRFENINYIKNVSDNTINIIAEHYWWGAPSFPTLVFNYPQRYMTDTFYLTSSYAPPYQENNFNKEIIFSFSTQNADINYMEGNLEVHYISKDIFINGLNEMIKINPKNEN